MEECAICNTQLRSDKAFMDERWETINDKALCRVCARNIAQLVIDEY